MSGVLGDLVGFRFGHLGFKEMDLVKPDAGAKIIAGIDVFYMIFAKQNDMKRNEMIVHNFSIWMKCNFQGCSFIVNGAKLSLDNGRIGGAVDFFCWPKKR